MAPHRELAAQRKPSKSEKSLKDKRARDEHVTSVVSQVIVLLLCFTSRVCLCRVARRDSNSGGLQAKHISEEGLKSHMENKKKDTAFASIFRFRPPSLLPPTACRPPRLQPRSHAIAPARSKSTGILGHSEGAHWGGAQGYRWRVTNV
jgi:hypothetical protein